MAGDDQLSTFLESFPTQLHYTTTDSFQNVMVFSSQQIHLDSTESSQLTKFCYINKIKSAFSLFWKKKTSFSNPNTRVIHDKIKSAFCKIDSQDLNGLIQFWTPVESNGKRILSTYDQPFAIEYLEFFKKYRLTSMTYQFEVEEEDISSPLATAFLNRFPIVLNLKVHQGSDRLVDSAFESGLTSSLFLPVFYPSDQTTSCVGVIECSVLRTGLSDIFSKLKKALQRVGLSTVHVQECPSYKSLCGFKCAKDELEEALEIVCESHDLVLGQVWIPCENENGVLFSSLLEETQTKVKFAAKLTGYCVNWAYNLKEYYDTCDMLPLKMGGGLPGKTLQTYEPHFCRNLDGLRDNGLLAILSANSEYVTTECSCLVICVRSIYTGDIDYALEFIWAKNRNYSILLESLLLTLKSWLPSFTLASGAQLGDELRVIDVENSTGSGIGFINILQGNGLSPIPKALKEKRIPVAEDYISSSQLKLNPAKESDCTLKRKSNVLGNSESQELNFVKRKLNNIPNFWVVIDPSEEDSKANQEPSASSHSVSCPGNDGLVIKVEYGDHRKLSYLPMSSKLADIKNYIDEKYNLGPGNYKLQFFADEWLRLVVEQDWETCILNRRVTKTQTIRLRVQPFTNLMVNGMYQ